MRRPILSLLALFGLLTVACALARIRAAVLSDPDNFSLFAAEIVVLAAVGVGICEWCLSRN
jgi:hypothetical protein